MGFGIGRKTYHDETARTYESGKRVKSTFENDMVAHVWATQTQSFGKSGNGNYYFKNRTLFSYGTHYVVGYVARRHDTSGEVVPVVFLNSDSRSPSTTRHVSLALIAARHYRAYSIPALTELASRDYDPLPRICESGDFDEIAMRRVVDHVRKHALEIDQEAACALLEIAGEKKPAQKFAALWKDREREQEKRAARQAKEKFNSHLELSRKVHKNSDGSPVFVAEWIKRVADWGGKHALKLLATSLHHAHRAAKKRKFHQVAESTYQALKAFRAAIEIQERREARKSRRNAMKAYIAAFRSFETTWKAYSTNGIKVFSANQWWQWQRAALDLSGLFHSSTRMRATLELVSNEIGRNRIARAQQEESERFERQAVERAAWLRGESVRAFRMNDECGGALLRVPGNQEEIRSRVAAGAMEGLELETSWGARVPLSHAVKAFKFLKRCKESGTAWTRNGHTIRVGHFQVDSVDAAGNFKAGCHAFNWPEVERIARALGVFESTPDDSALVSTGH